MIHPGELARGFRQRDWQFVAEIHVPEADAGHDK